MSRYVVRIVRTPNPNQIANVENGINLSASKGYKLISISATTDPAAQMYVWQAPMNRTDGGHDTLPWSDLTETDAQ